MSRKLYQENSAVTTGFSVLPSTSLHTGKA
jgi:hypothetical protein